MEISMDSIFDSDLPPWDINDNSVSTSMGCICGWWMSTTKLNLSWPLKTCFFKKVLTLTCCDDKTSFIHLADGVIARFKLVTGWCDDRSYDGRFDLDSLRYCGRCAVSRNSMVIVSRRNEQSSCRNNVDEPRRTSLLGVSVVESFSRRVRKRLTRATFVNSCQSVSNCWSS